MCVIHLFEPPLSTINYDITTSWLNDSWCLCHQPVSPPPMLMEAFGWPLFLCICIGKWVRCPTPLYLVMAKHCLVLLERPLSIGAMPLVGWQGHSGIFSVVTVKALAGMHWPKEQHLVGPVGFAERMEGSQMFKVSFGTLEWPPHNTHWRPLMARQVATVSQWLGTLGSMTRDNMLWSLFSVVNLTVC